MDKSESAVVTLVKRVARVSVVSTVMISSLMVIVPVVMPTPKPLLSMTAVESPTLPASAPLLNSSGGFLEKLELIITQRRPG